jgi:tol-pal system protein YbgF
VRLTLAKGASRGLMAAAIVLAVGALSPQFVFAQSKSEAELAVQVQQLEDQVRTLTGQVEGLQFQLTQMQELIQKQNDDNEFRFQQLEGGAGKKSSAATQSDGVTPSGALPQPSEAASQENQQSGATTMPPPPEQDAAVPAAPTGQDIGGAPAGADDAAVAPDGTKLPPADVGGQPDDGLGKSRDPLVGKGGGEINLGTMPANGLPADDGTSRPLDLTLANKDDLSNGDAEAQYKAGYDAIVRGDYSFAEEQFRQFLSLYPKDPEAPDAANWLGEALLQRQAYDDAADVLLTGFQNYEKSARAPDILMKLGIALSGAGEQDTACRTFAEVLKRYPQQPAAFNQRLAQEKQKARCPA